MVQERLVGAGQHRGHRFLSQQQLDPGEHRVQPEEEVVHRPRLRKTDRRKSLFKGGQKGNTARHTQTLMSFNFANRAIPQ